MELTYVIMSIKTLGVHMSHKKKLQDYINFYTVVKSICNVIKIWRIWSLYLDGKVTIFKTLGISKMSFLTLLIILPKNIVEEQNKLQKMFVRPNVKCKFKHGTQYDYYKHGGLKNVYL